MATIVSLAFTPFDIPRKPKDHYARSAIERMRLIHGHGIAGDVKSHGGKRQMNVMRAETVAELAAEGFVTTPGALGEQLVIAGLEEAALAVGSRLRLGSAAVIEITEPREPCGRFVGIQGQPMEAALGRIGAMARVIEDGEIGVGDAVHLEVQAQV